ncbi:MAG: ComEC/Rec2 family competence protein [Opitutaceae bacterium]|jgi:competence protein ComEC|nr:ComEC/Rec2 family competence protein [Opitutaceae bacterium]
MSAEAAKYKRAPLLWLLLPLVCGLIAGHAGLAKGWDVRWVAAVAVAAGCLGIFNGRRFGVVFAAVAMALGGLALYEWRQARLPEWDKLPPREARAKVELSRVFPAAAGARSVSALGRIVECDAPVAELAGQRVHVSFDRRTAGDKAPARGSVVVMTGVLEVVAEGAGAGEFDGFLNNEGIHFRIGRGRVREVVRGGGWWARFCEAGQERLSGFLGVGVEGKRGDLTGIFRAMLLGRKHELSGGQKELFMRSGTMHLFAISGLHVAAIWVALELLLAVARVPRKAAFFAGLAALWLYVEVTGGAPSAVRAFWMVALTQAARVFRVPGSALSGLCAAALGALVFSPMQLFAAGFQMSYGIVASLLLFGVPLGRRLKERWALFGKLPKATWTWRHKAADAVWRGFLEAAGVGLAATLVSLTSGVLFFGVLAPGAFFANLALIPLASLVIFAGFASMTLGLVFWGHAGWVASVFNHAGALVLAGMEWLVRFFRGVPGLFFEARFREDWMGFATLGGCLALAAAGYALGWRRGWWFAVPFVFLGAALAAGVVVSG